MDSLITLKHSIEYKAQQNKILEIRSGSYLYGTNTETSDQDFTGVFMPPEEYVYGLQSVNEVNAGTVDKDENNKNTKDAVDKKLYEFRKFINLALANNPNILEILFVNKHNITFINDFGQELLDNCYLFPYKGCVNKFLGYAKAQKHKMQIKSDKYIELVKGLKELDNFTNKTPMAQVSAQYILCKDKVFYQPQLDGHIWCGDICFEPGIYVKKAKKMLQHRINAATNRSDLILKYGFDVKFASHLIRLLTEGIDLLRNGYLEFPLPNIYTIIDIKNGRWPLKDIIQYSEHLEKELEQVHENSKLPKKPRFKEINQLTINMIRKYLNG